MFTTTEEVIARFRTKYEVDETTNCWNWLGHLRNYAGYGAFKIKGKNYLAHRVSYIIFKGEIPKGLSTCHRCDSRKCVNPEHLYLGTHSQNIQDCWDKDRHPIYEKRDTLTQSTVRRIREFKLRNKSIEEISGLLKLNRSTVRRVVTKQTYSKVV